MLRHSIALAVLAAASVSSVSCKPAAQGKMTFKHPLGGTVIIGRDNQPERDPEPLTKNEVVTRLTTSPVRWTYLDDTGQTKASGIAMTAATNAGTRVDIAVHPREPQTPAASTTAKAGDGTKHVFVVDLGNAQWEGLQAVRMRREIPEIDEMLRLGVRANVKGSPSLKPPAGVTVERVDVPEAPSTPGQDDGQGAAYDAYRAADKRVAAVRAGADADDVVVLTSKKGVFVAAGSRLHAKVVDGAVDVDVDAAISKLAGGAGDGPIVDALLQ